ncbi:hypothetical protein CEXT_339991 [Caerostris extrusa]|uniref:Uncharacterized protein n=1 Tax=Caerostris extrusa TaxID=172846 RepID=A0AAV4Q5M8_CAEEX|nr:hypothetical protein CEXT_339991 [Caerostris extrusa]
MSENPALGMILTSRVHRGVFLVLKMSHTTTNIGGIRKDDALIRRSLYSTTWRTRCQREHHRKEDIPWKQQVVWNEICSSGQVQSCLDDLQLPRYSSES